MNGRDSGAYYPGFDEEPKEPVQTSGRFSIIPARAIDDNALPRGALLVLCALGTYSDRDGWCWPSQATVAKRVRITQPAVAQHIRTLRDLDYIQVVHRVRDDGGAMSNKYRILHDGYLPEERDAAPPEEPPGRDVEEPRGVCASMALIPPISPELIGGISPELIQTYQVNVGAREHETSAEVSLAASEPPLRPRILEALAKAEKRPRETATALGEVWAEMLDSSAPPPYSLLMKLAKQVGGAGRLVPILIECGSHEILGEPAAYVVKVVQERRNGELRGRRAGGGGAADGADRSWGVRRPGDTGDTSDLSRAFQNRYPPGYVPVRAVRADVPDA